MIMKQRNVILMTVICIVVFWIFMALRPAAAEDRTRSFYDGRGSFAGSSTTYNGGRNTSAYDRNGSFSGSAIRNSNGTTSFYDKSGHFTGSSVDTGPRR
jgi:hypothetical protein